MTPDSIFIYFPLYPKKVNCVTEISLHRNRVRLTVRPVLFSLFKKGYLIYNKDNKIPTYVPTNLFNLPNKFPCLHLFDLKHGVKSLKFGYETDFRIPSGDRLRTTTCSM